MKTYLNRIIIFSYGSNMYSKRLIKRVPSADIYGIGKLRGFKIEFSNLVASIPEYGKNKQKNEYKRIQYNKNSINVSSLREVMKKLIYSWHKYKHLGSVYLNFNVEPDVVSDNFIDLTDFLIGF